MYNFIDAVRLMSFKNEKPQSQGSVDNTYSNYYVKFVFVITANSLFLF